MNRAGRIGNDAESLRVYLAGSRPLLFDGAMSTLLARRSNAPADQSEQVMLEQPELVSEIVREYLAAGSMALKTNTFGLSEKAGLFLDENGQTTEAGREAETIIRTSLDCVNKAVQEVPEHPVWVFADFGPFPDALDRKSRLEAAAFLVDAFLEKGIECFLFETQSSDEGLSEIAQMIKTRCPQAFVLVSFAVGADGLSRKGKSARMLLEAAEDCPWIDAIGLNCLCGPMHMEAVVRDLPAFSKPLSIMPNAGYPSVTARHSLYKGTPEYFARKMESIALHGASILGGCCGTTPDFIEALHARLEHLPKPSPLPDRVDRAEDKRPKRASMQLDELKADGKKAILVELDPPANDRIGKFLEGAGRLQRAGAHVLTIADNPIGRPRADSSLLACKVRRELGMDVLPHMTCRDRNLNAIKALLLALSMEDVHQALLVTGDPLPLETRDDVKAVFSFNSRTLASFVRTLGEEGVCEPFLLLGALDVNARNFDVQLRIAREKEANGIEGFLTQPVFSQRAIENLKRARKELKGRIYGGLMSIVSYRNACFLKNEISGMDIPDALADAYQGKSREECEAISLQACLETARAIESSVDGYYLMTPFQRIALMEALIEKLKLL